MLDLRWPAEILEMPGCETLQVDNQVVFKGPRVKVAFRAGSALIKEPHPSTGRADYFGGLPRTVGSCSSGHIHHLIPPSPPP